MLPDIQVDEAAQQNEAGGNVEGEITNGELDETNEDMNAEGDGEFHTDDEIDNKNMDDLVIVNPEAEKMSGKMTPKVNNSTPRESIGGAESMRSQRRTSKSESKHGSHSGSIAGSGNGRGTSGGAIDSKPGSMYGSKPASPCISVNGQDLGRGKSPTQSHVAQNEILRCSSLPVLPEEGEVENVRLTPQRIYSRTPSALSFSRTQTPSHGILKTPNRSTPVAPSKLRIVDDAFRVEIEKSIANATGFVEENMERNLDRVNEIGGTPLQKLRSRANSLIQAVGSRLPSRAQSRAASKVGSPVASRGSRKGSQAEKVEKTLELAADALAEQGESKDETKEKATEGVGQNADEAGAVQGDPNATGNSKMSRSSVLNYIKS